MERPTQPLQIIVEEHAGETWLRLPPRQLPWLLRRFASAMLALGLVFGAAGGWPLLMGERRASLALYLVALGLGAALVVLGMRLLYGRVQLRCGGATLTVVERLGPIAWRKRLAFGELTDLRVETFNVALPKPAAPDKTVPGAAALEAIPILSVTTVARGKRVLLFCYPDEVLRQVVGELHRRGFLRSTAIRPV